MDERILDELEETLDAIAGAIRGRMQYDDPEKRLLVIRTLADLVREDLAQVEQRLAEIDAEGG